MGQDALSVAIVPPRAYVRVQGRGSFHISPALKKFADSAMRRGCRVFVIDMETCAAMDSTFMGVIAGIAMRLRRIPDRGETFLVNLDTKNAGLLETLGLANVLHLLRAPLTDEQRQKLGLPRDEETMERLEPEKDSRTETARTMLAAHENLVAVSQDNLPRFQDVLTYLRNDIRRDEDSGEKD